jgi:hypothetical protein
MDYVYDPGGRCGYSNSVFTAAMINHHTGVATAAPTTTLVNGPFGGMAQIIPLFFLERNAINAVIRMCNG